ncbi:BgTH12-05891 [Blumeria graminis f. sp. triticale]|nr:BgTH12-04021 [Blumeria graminis f. sp. triticale]CAD6504156.1 BgTH12-05891 [Blumeria graminis f. sp. triticale]
MSSPNVKLSYRRI